MQEVRQLFIRGLEHSIAVEFNDTYNMFDVSCIFKAFNQDITRWQDTFVEDKVYLCSPSSFINALEFCSITAQRFTHEMNFILFMFAECKDVQWTELELCKLFTTGTRPIVPLSGNHQAAIKTIRKLRRRVDTYKRDRECVKGDLGPATESIAKLLRIAKSHIVVMPLTRKDDDEEAEDSD